MLDPPLTIDLFRSAIDILHGALYAPESLFVVLCTVLPLPDQVQMHLDGIRPEFANLSTIKGKVSAAKLIEFVMHRVCSVCPVVLALVSVELYLCVWQ